MDNEQVKKTIDYWLTSAEKLKEVKEMFEWLKEKLKRL